MTTGFPRQQFLERQQCNAAGCRHRYQAQLRRECLYELMPRIVELRSGTGIGDDNREGHRTAHIEAAADRFRPAQRRRRQHDERGGATRRR